MVDLLRCFDSYRCARCAALRCVVVHGHVLLQDARHSCTPQHTAQLSRARVCEHHAAPHAPTHHTPRGHRLDLGNMLSSSLPLPYDYSGLLCETLFAQLLRLPAPRLVPLAFSAMIAPVRCARACGRLEFVRARARVSGGLSVGWLRRCQTRVCSGLCEHAAASTHTMHHSEPHHAHNARARRLRCCAPHSPSTSLAACGSCTSAPRFWRRSLCSAWPRCSRTSSPT
jgi:hypothetical protein